MSHTVLLLVLLAAFLHAAWNALLRGGRDRFQSVTIMSFTAALVCVPFMFILPMPLARAWPYAVASGIVHVIYNLLLIRQYRQGDFGQYLSGGEGFFAAADYRGRGFVCVGAFVGCRSPGNRSGFHWNTVAGVRGEGARGQFRGGVHDGLFDCGLQCD